MKIIFEKSSILIYLQEVLTKTIQESDFGNSSSNNVLFSLLEICTTNEGDIEMVLKDNASPFVKKMHEIFYEEFIGDRRQL